MYIALCILCKRHLLVFCDKEIISEPQCWSYQRKLRGEFWIAVRTASWTQSLRLRLPRQKHQHLHMCRLQQLVLQQHLSRPHQQQSPALMVDFQHVVMQIDEGKISELGCKTLNYLSQPTAAMFSLNQAANCCFADRQAWHLGSTYAMETLGSDWVCKQSGPSNANENLMHCPVIAYMWHQDILSELQVIL